MKTATARLARGVLSMGVMTWLLAVAGSAGPADAHATITSADIKYRHAVMTALGTHMGSIAAIAKGEVGHAGHMFGHASAIDTLASMMGDLFPEGSGGEASRAKDEIWRDKAGFDAAVEAFRAVAAKLLEATETGDTAAIGAALGGVGKSCSSCHRAFRKPKS